MARNRFFRVTGFVAWALGVPLLALLSGVAVFLFTELGDIPFDNPDLWWVSAVVPVAGGLLVLAALRRRRSLERFASPALAPVLTGGFQPQRQALRSGMLVLALLLLVAALLGPRWGMYVQKQEAYGVDVVVALDVSRSMLARDVEPSRLERAKREITAQLTERSIFGRGNRLGLLAFAGSTSMKVPLTLDHGFFESAVDRLDTASAPRGGTAIAQAIAEAGAFFRASPPEATKLIIVFTDGEDHEGDPVDEARRMYEEYGIRTYTIAVGDPTSPSGAQVPASPDPGAGPLVHDGQIVFSKIDVDGLRGIAEAGGGRFATVRDFHRVVEGIAELEQHHLTTEERMRHRPQYQWFLAGAIILLLAEPMISDRRRRVDGPIRLWQQEMAA
jgi:Ca-activated chloride channel family protein